MTNHTNTSGGASIGGNVETNEFVGRDKQTINNIIIVGRFLEFAQIEELLPKLEHKQDFSSVVEAIESNLGSRLDDDLADAVAWVGEILQRILPKVLPQDNLKPIVLSAIAPSIIRFIGVELQSNGFWKAYSQDSTLRVPAVASKDIISLEVTTALVQRYKLNDLRQLYLLYLAKSQNCRLANLTYDSTLGDEVIQSLNLRKFSPRHIRLIIAGIVLDLIRIKSDNTISVQFIKELADIVKPDSSKS